MLHTGIKLIYYRMEKQSIILQLLHGTALHCTALKGIYSYYIQIGGYLLLWNGTLCEEQIYMRPNMPSAGRL
jgi:hypothetical protein